MATTLTSGKVETYLGAKADSLLGFKSPKIAKERLHLPGPDFIDRVYAVTDRNLRVLTNLQRLFGHGRLSGTGYLSILPVDQGIAHSGLSSSAWLPVSGAICATMPSRKTRTLTSPPTSPARPTISA